MATEPKEPDFAGINGLYPAILLSSHLIMALMALDPGKF